MSASADIWRHVMFSLRELRVFLLHHLAAVEKKSDILPDVRDKVRYTVNHAEEYLRIIRAELEEVSDWQERYSTELKTLAEVVQQRIHSLQNSEDCRSAPTLVCNMSSPLGMANTVHDVLWCFVKAFHSGRRLVLLSSPSHIFSRGWTEFFQPLSETCRDDNVFSVTPYPGKNDHHHRRLLDVLPEDIGARLVHLHGDPLAWWYGQFMTYLMRPNDRLQMLLEKERIRTRLWSPIAGIHVRRTDKIGSEAQNHSLEEYMVHVEDYFRRLELSGREVTRRVYVATDDPGVLDECKNKYPEYHCFYHPGGATLATNLTSRDSNASTWGALVDVFQLSRTDFVVCTLSSGLCRLAYELKSASFPGDSSECVQSLDGGFHYDYVLPPAREVLYSHVPMSTKELSLWRGDLIQKKDEWSFINDAVAGEVWCGLQTGQNQRTLQIGLYPVYKTLDKFQLGQFPDYGVPVP